MRALPIAILLAVAALAAAADAPCTCREAKLVNAWCKHCEVGYVAGIEVPYPMLFEALDAHGHDIDPASVTCPSCRRALVCDGYCEIDRYGFVDGRLYFSKLTWLVARGERRDVASLTCPVCRASATTRRADAEHSPAWCETCKVGMIGNVAFRDRAMFDQAVKEYRMLLAAIETSRRCEYCGVARFLGSSCPRCHIDYGVPAVQTQ